jgi:hypothetical protein
MRNIFIWNQICTQDKNKLLLRSRLEWHYLRAEFIEILPSGSKVIREGQTDIQTGDLISLRHFFESRLVNVLVGTLNILLIS